VVSSRQKLEAQKQENSGVKSEFGKLKDGEVIYKLIGPALLKQERAEAEATVDGRLDFINKDIARQEGKIKEIQEKLERVKGDIIRIQSSAQSAAQGKQPAAAAKA
jgi:prefoldin beta subunit